MPTFKSQAVEEAGSGSVDSEDMLNAHNANLSEDRYKLASVVDATKDFTPYKWPLLESPIQENNVADNNDADDDDVVDADEP